jgi:hypothetical protein
MIRISLPLPIPSNSAYRNVAGVGRVKTKRMKAWLLEAGWMVKTQRFKPIVGPYRFAIYVPAKMRGDVDGRVKLAQDLFVSLGLTPDDHYAVYSYAERNASVPKNECLVVIKGVSEA